MTTPLERYRADIESGRFREDPEQAAVVQHLQRLWEALAERPPQSLLDRLLRRPRTPVRGLYLWGGTGRGKTWLVDSFFDCLPFAEKRRLHFHRFMQHVHGELKTLPRTPDPLEVVARRFAREVRLLCLDEFHVQDIADAMLLGGLLKALFEQGVTLVATSNTPIDELYLEGLQRDRFLFAIELLKRHTQAVHLPGGRDFRLERLEKGGPYQVARGEEAERLMRGWLEALAPVPPEHGVCLELNGHEVPARAVAGDLAWFEFGALCEAPLWAADYLEIAQAFHTLLISGVPRMGEDSDDAAKRFMHLIDTLYDHRVKLVVAAEAPPQSLYTGRYLAFAFQRTASRLIEMGSRRYLEKPHR